MGLLFKVIIFYALFALLLVGLDTALEVSILADTVSGTVFTALVLKAHLVVLV